MRTMLFMLVLAVPTAALAQGRPCQLRLQPTGVVRWNASPGGEYSVFDPQEYDQQVEIQIEHRGEACDYFVTFSQGNRGSFDRRVMGRTRGSLFYNLYDSPTKTNVLKDLPEARASEVLTGSFPRGRRVRVSSFTWVIEPGQVSPPRVPYADSVLVSVYRGSLASPVLEDQHTVRFRARIRPEVQTSFRTGAGDLNTVDFGELQEGEEQNVSIWVRSNGRYVMELESEGNGALRHIDPGQMSSVPYQVFALGRALDLSGGSANLGTPQTGSGETSYNLRLVIGSLTGAIPGQHQDRLTIVVTAN